MPRKRTRESRKAPSGKSTASDSTQTRGSESPSGRKPPVREPTQPRPGISEKPRWEKAPLTTPRARLRAEARLKDIGERIRRGDDSDLRRLTHPRVGTTGRGLALQCNGYLPKNRFQWFDARAPDTDGIRIRAPAVNAQEALRDEFCSPFSTVVGMDVGEVAANVGRTVGWQDFPDGFSPNAVPGLEFFVRTTRVESPPRLDQAVVSVGGPRPTAKKVLVNPAGSSLFIDFLFPQRAVGLEYGFLGQEGETIGYDSIELIARNADGAMIFTSTGRATGQFGTGPQAGSVFNVIGVRDAGGAIRSVELLFPDHPDKAQLVARIWHEPLPNAAVKEGVLSQQEEVTLPFNCDRALALLRGFKLWFVDNRAHEVGSISAGVDLIDTQKFADGRTVVTLRPSGVLSSEHPAMDYGVQIYYTLLAWNADHVELHTRNVFDTARDLLRFELSSRIVGLQEDPCTAEERAGSIISEACGNLFGGLRWFRASAPGSREWFDMHLATGVEGGIGCAFEIDKTPGFIRSGEISFPVLDRRGGGIAWEVCSKFRYDFAQGSAHEHLEGTYAREVFGTLITGRSLRVTAPSFPAVTLQDKAGRRASPDDWLNDEWVWPVDGDIAFVALQSFYFDPDGPIRELEIEVHGHDYQGTQVQWWQGGGVVGEDEGDEHSILGFATVGALVRTAANPRPRLMTQDVEFTGIVGFLSLVPSTYGAVRSIGNVPVLITGAQLNGQHADKFHLQLEYRGEVFALDELPRRVPLPLSRDNPLVIGGTFFPRARARPNAPHRVTIEFATNHPQMPMVYINVYGRTREEDAKGSWAPDRINFGLVPVPRGSSQPVVRLRVAVLQSTGQTPLLIQSLALADDTLGFDFGILNWYSTPTELGDANISLEPGSALDIQVAFSPRRVGQVETKLVAETNYGRLELPLGGEGVN